MPTKKVKINRSAVTGEFVTKKKAKRSPKTTVTETVKKKVSTKKKAKKKPHQSFPE